MDAAMPSHQALKDVLLEKKYLTFEFLAVQIFLTRAKRQVKEEPSTLDANVRAFSELLYKYKSLPAVMNDIEKMR